MLLSESDNARILRQIMLDIVALRDFVDMGNSKYAIYTDKIYQSIFKEKAQEYKKILKLTSKDSARKTMYSEVLDLIASY